MSEPVWYAEARRLVAEEGRTRREAVEACGKKHPNYKPWIDPEKLRESTRRSNARRRQAKQAWEDEYYHGDCIWCGGLTRRPSYEFCEPCWTTIRALVRDANLNEIARRWRDGQTARQIAEALGWDHLSVHVQVSRMRAEGRDLPIRNFATHDHMVTRWKQVAA